MHMALCSHRNALDFSSGYRCCLAQLCWVTHAASLCLSLPAIMAIASFYAAALGPSRRSVLKLRGILLLCNKHPLCSAILP